METEATDNSVPPSPATDHSAADNAKHNNLKITIATVTWNAGSLIGRTIRSVEEQSYPYVEHLIIDGNSHDDTLEHVHHYQERNSRADVQHEIVCLSEPDNGLYDAMNKALHMATGRYILFLNAGDALHSPHTLEEIARAAHETPVLPAVIYGDTHLVDNEGHFLRRRRLTPPEQLDWRSFKQGMLVCHQAFFVRTDIARYTPYDLRYRFSADFDWCIRLMRQAAEQHLPLNNSHTVVADYLSEGLTTRHHKASLCERFRIMTKHYGLCPTLMQHVWFVVRSFLKK